MYRELAHKKLNSIAKVIIGVVIVVALAFGGVALYHVAHESAKEQGAASVRQTILDAAAQCAAVEGAYPSTLEHLENSYGLRVNHQEYDIIFESYAANFPPSVVVTPK